MPKKVVKTAARKRPAAGTAATGGAKRARTGISSGASRGGGGSVRIKADPDASSTASAVVSASKADKDAKLQDEFMAMFSDLSVAAAGGISNAALKTKFGDARLPHLAKIINTLTSRGRLTMSRHAQTGELIYNLVSESQASKFEGLDLSARLVYQIIEKAGNMGIWTKDIRTQSNIQQQALNKIFKSLESRRLIKPCKSVTAKAKKLYMLYDLTPAKEITGGPWYTELEFDHEFISELRTFIMHCVRRLNGGKGITLTTIMDKMKEANVSRVQLSIEEVRQLVQTLVYDYMVESVRPPAGVLNGEELYVAARRVSSMCDFKWWDVLDSDFHFRAIEFEDGVTLAPHEPHHHTA